MRRIDIFRVKKYHRRSSDYLSARWSNRPGYDWYTATRTTGRRGISLRPVRAVAARGDGRLGVAGGAAADVLAYAVQRPAGALPGAIRERRAPHHNARRLAHRQDGCGARGRPFS